MIEPFGPNPLAGLHAQAEAAQRAGLDLVAVSDIDSSTGSRSWSAPALAASLAGVARGLRVVVQLGIGDHPIELSEELVVADLALGGRLLAVLDPTAALDLLDETLTVLLNGVRGTPFRHRGERWTIPRAASNGVAVDAWVPRTVTVTPPPAQLELPVYVLGITGIDAAAAHGVAPVGTATDNSAAMRDTWRALESSHPSARHRWRRSAIRPFVDAGTLVERLRAERRAWNLDTCMVKMPRTVSVEQRCRDVVSLGAARARLQLDVLPDGLDMMWSAAFPTPDRGDPT